MSKTGTTARWTASTGASLVLMVVVALVAAPVVGAGPGDGGGNDPIAGLIGGDGPGFSGGGGGDERGGGDRRGGGQGVHGRAMSKGDPDSYGLGLRAHGDGDKARGRLVFGHRGESGGEGFAGDITCLSVGEDGVVQVSGFTREGRGHRHDHGDHRRRHGDGKQGEPGKGEKQGEPGKGEKEGESGHGGEESEPAPAAFAGGGRHGGGHDGSKDGSKAGSNDGSKDGKDGSKAGSKDGKDGSKAGSKDGKGGSKDDGSKDGTGEEMSASQDFAFTILTRSDPQQFSLPKLAKKGELTPCGGGDATTVAVTRGGFRAHR